MLYREVPLNSHRTTSLPTSPAKNKIVQDCHIITDPLGCPPTSIELAIGGDASELDKTKEWFVALAEGGSVTMPIS